LRRPTPTEVVLLAQLLPMAVGCRFLTRYRSVGQLVRAMDRTTRGPLANLPWPAQRIAQSRLQVLVDWCAQRVAGERCCLVRAMLWYWVLRWGGVDAQLVLGVRRNGEAEGIGAHAWVEAPGHSVIWEPVAPTEHGYVAIARLGTS